MAFNKEIFDLAKVAALGKGYTFNSETFSASDVQESLRAELKKVLGGNYYNFQKNKMDLYELIAVTIDQVLPARVTAVMNQFAEVLNLPQGGKATFRKKLGRTRAKQFIGRVSPAGIYETFRLDTETFELATKSHGGGVRIDFERFLDGTEDWNELVQIVMDGLEEAVYTEIATTLNASYAASGRPSNTVQSDAAYDASNMHALVTAIRNYGAGAVIFATPGFVSTMGDAVVYASAGQYPTVSTNDIEDLRTKGYIGMFYGAPIVMLPNSYTDETNATLQLSDSVAYVMPTGGEKPVKVVFEGGALVNDLGQLPGDYSMELMVYKKFGTAVVYTNNWGIYRITG